MVSNKPAESDSRSQDAVEAGVSTRTVFLCSADTESSFQTAVNRTLLAGTV